MSEYFNSINALYTNNVYRVLGISQHELDMLGNSLTGGTFNSISFTKLFDTNPSEWTFIVYAYPLKLTVLLDSYPLMLGDDETKIKVGGVAYDSYMLSTNVYYGTLGSQKFYEYGDYTNIELYLPFFGYVSIDPYTISNKFLHLALSIDFMTGTGTYTLLGSIEPIIVDVYPKPITNSFNSVLSDCIVISQFTANIGVEIPITRTNANDTKRNLIYTLRQSTSSALIGAKIGKKLGPKGAITGAIAGASIPAIKNAVSESKIQRATSNEVGGTAFSAVGEDSAFFRILKANPVVKEGTEEWLNYLHQNGAPLVRYVSDLVDFVDSGYTELSSFHLDGPDFNIATEQELDELETLLSKGIIL